MSFNANSDIPRWKEWKSINTMEYAYPLDGDVTLYLNVNDDCNYNLYLDDGKTKVNVFALSNFNKVRTQTIHFNEVTYFEEVIKFFELNNMVFVDTEDGRVFGPYLNKGIGELSFKCGNFKPL